MFVRRLVVAILAALLLAPALVLRPALPVAAAGECVSGAQYFPATKKCVAAVFYAYWQSHGGLAQQGLPVTDLFTEISASDGKAYAVQYFERARFEYHPEQADPQYQVLLGLLGAEQVQAKYPQGRPARGGQCQAGERYFDQTQHCVPALFYAYWQGHGGLAQQGLPISDPFTETNPTDGKPYLTQYFERARFEAHPENAAPYDVLLGLLGGEQVKAKYPDVIPVAQDTLVGPTGPFEPAPNDGTATLEYANGGLHLALRNNQKGNFLDTITVTNGNPAAAVNVRGLNDVRIELDVTKTSGADSGLFGVVCRDNEKDDHYYEFLIGADGYYAINRLTGLNDSDFAHLAGGGDSKSPAIRTGNATNHLRVDCKGDTLTLSVNGQQVAQAHDAAIKAGAGFGIEAGTPPGGNLDLVFRNFALGILP